MEAIREVGAFAGLAAFLGLAVLALLYFAQARDVRRLRENAEFLIEGEPVAPVDEEAEPVPAAVAAEEPAEAARVAAATAPNEAEAFRRAELARQAAERRQRFEQRRRGGGRGPAGWFDELPSSAVIIVGALILVAGVGFGATRLLGGDDEPGAGSGGGGNFACPPPQTKVAVLNGTAEAGLAAGFAQELKQSNYDVGPVTNTESGFESSSVMFDQDSQECAPEVSGVVSVASAEPMSEEIRSVAEGAALAVVLGEDKGSGEATTSDESTATDAGSSGTLVD
jgi:hypothetical protein